MKNSRLTVRVVAVTALLSAAVAGLGGGIANAAENSHGHYGDPDQASQYWVRQTLDDCSLMATADVIGQLTGNQPSEGEIVFDGRPGDFKDIRSSEQRGIAIIHQELALVPVLSIAENIFLGNEVATRGVIDRNATNDRTAALLAKVGLRESPDRPELDPKSYGFTDADMDRPIFIDNRGDSIVWRKREKIGIELFAF